MGSKTDALYFGCWGQSGHWWWSQSGRRANDEAQAAGVPAVDGLLAPGAPDRLGASGQPQSAARLHHINGWTLLAMWDRSVDGRGGANSVFAVHGLHDFEQACELARAAFPSVWARIEAVKPIELHSVAPSALVVQSKARWFDQVGSLVGAIGAAIPERVEKLRAERDALRAELDAVRSELAALREAEASLEPVDQPRTGVYDKFEVRRRDGRDQPGGDREGARYFVLDRTHDEFAGPALRAYAEAARETYPHLACELLAGLPEATPTDPTVQAVDRLAGAVEALTAALGARAGETGR